MARFTLKNVRLSFPSLFKKAEFDGTATKFEATFLIEKTDPQVEMINKAIDDFLAQKFPNGAPKSVKRTVFVDGDTKDYDGYSGCMAFKGSNSKRPTVIDRDRTPLIEEDNKPEAGDYVNAIVDLWYSDHPKGGKQVLGNVLGVQFVREGERFGADTTASAEDFEIVDDEEF